MRCSITLQSRRLRQSVERQCLPARQSRPRPRGAATEQPPLRPRDRTSRSVARQHRAAFDQHPRDLPLGEPPQRDLEVESCHPLSRRHAENKDAGRDKSLLCVRAAPSPSRSPRPEFRARSARACERTGMRMFAVEHDAHRRAVRHARKPAVQHAGRRQSPYRCRPGSHRMWPASCALRRATLRRRYAGRRPARMSGLAVG